jgi:thioesterase domain-containing protein
MLDTWQKSYPAISLVNMYGITETCVHVTFKEVNEEDIAAGVGNIGRPLPDTTLYVTDPYLRMLPAGLPGEMCVGGGGVARGYLGRDELTVDRFVPDPFRPGSRLYRSGDVGRYLQNGELEYLGRLDSQVQIRGFRVEPGEIENRLGEHPAVSRAAVRVWGRHVDGEPSDGSDKIVVAYYVLSPVATRGKEPGAEDLKWFLTERLPGYMVPSYVIRMDALPVTTGGKVDRKLLPDPRSAVLAAGETIAPRDPVELSLLEIWEDLIGVHIGSIDADFFLCGGHSLLAVKLISRINRLFGTSYAVSWAFVNKTIEKQARALREAGGSTPFRPLVAFNRKGDKPPLFFVHPGQAGAEAYSRLASLLDAARPFYAIESRNLYDQKRPMLRTVESLSDAYISDILSLCGEGPCLLGGWSFGGLVAFEMARVMLERGIEVGGLFLIDAFYHDSEERELLSELAKSTELSDLLAGNALYGDLPEKYRSRLVDVTRLEFEAMALYEARPFAGRAVLIKPSEERPAPGTRSGEKPLVETLFSRYSMSADNGWSSLIGNLEIHPVPGDHITMMEGRGLKEIARIVSGPRT